MLGAAVPLLGATEALAALGAMLRLRRDGATVDPALAARLDAVLDALGIAGAADELQPAETQALLGIVEGFLAQAVDFVLNPARTTWDHQDPQILLAQGQTSTLMSGVWQRFLVPALDGDLAARLEQDGAAFLDVGVGVASLAVDMCRRWPSLRVVGLDPWEPALAIAREQVAVAGLENRIELRQDVVEALEDEEAYDLAWVPTFFIPAPVVESAIERVRASLRPGGWVMLGLYARPPDPFVASLADLRTVRHGGVMWTPQETAEQLSRAGFADVDVKFEPEWRLPIVFVAGRRP